MGMYENYMLPGDSVSGQICSGAGTLTSLHQRFLSSLMRSDHEILSGKSC
jgi:hypothetical protein